MSNSNEHENGYDSDESDEEPDVTISDSSDFLFRELLMLALLSYRRANESSHATKKTFIEKLNQNIIGDNSCICDECSICKEIPTKGDTVTELPCKHSFHFECIKPWLGKHNTCPLCRHELPKEENESFPRVLEMRFEVSPSGIRVVRNREESFSDFETRPNRRSRYETQ